MRFEYVKNEFDRELKADFKEIMQECKSYNLKDILSTLMLILAFAEIYFFVILFG